MKIAKVFLPLIPLWMFPPSSFVENYIVRPSRCEVLKSKHYLKYIWWQSNFHMALCKVIVEYVLEYLFTFVYSLCIGISSKTKTNVCLRFCKI
jgi:hypothetical protein